MFKVCINYRWNAFESSNISLKCSKPPRFMTHPIILNVKTADLMHCCVPLKKSEDHRDGLLVLICLLAAWISCNIVLNFQSSFSSWQTSYEITHACPECFTGYLQQLMSGLQLMIIVYSYGDFPRITWYC